MPAQIPVNLNQTENNQLTSLSDQQRINLIPKNDYNKVGNEYSAVNKDAIADGDSRGRGTGISRGECSCLRATQNLTVERLRGGLQALPIL